MASSLQRNFLFIWILVLLGLAIVLSLTFSGCSSGTSANSQNAESPPVAPAEGAATSVLGCTDINGTVSSEDETRKDMCIEPFFVDYYCENGKIENINKRCECENGKCKN